MKSLLTAAAGVALFTTSGFAHAELPTKMRCKVSGSAGCSEICVGAGIRDPSVTLIISRSSHTIILNGVSGVIDNRAGDPYADGNHNVAWAHDMITYNSYRLNRTEPGRLFLTLSKHDAELEFHCLGSLYAKQPKH